MSDLFETRLRRAPVARDFGLTILACEEGWHTITSVEPGGEGDQAGLSVGDMICEVDGKALPRRLHSIVSYLPSRDSQEYTSLGVRRSRADQTVGNKVPGGESAAVSLTKPRIPLAAAKAAAAKVTEVKPAVIQVSAAKVKARPSSLGLAAEAKATAEADAAAAKAAEAKAARQAKQEEVVVHTSGGEVWATPSPVGRATFETGTTKHEAARAQKQEPATTRPAGGALPQNIFAFLSQGPLCLCPPPPACNPSPVCTPCLLMLALMPFSAEKCVRRRCERARKHPGRPTAHAARRRCNE